MHKLNEHGEALVKSAEACILYAYDDQDGHWPRREVKPGDVVKGVLTAGWGHTGADVKPGMKVTKEKAQAWFETDMAIFVAAMNEDVAHISAITENQFSALVSLIFNIGDPAFDKSTMYRFLAAGDVHSTAAQFPRWSYDNHKWIDGLHTRRLKEQTLFLTPDGQTPDYSNIKEH